MESTVVQRKIQAAEAVARALAQTEGAGALIDSAYVAGSITAGLGNSTSDADVFVLHHTGKAPDVATQQFNVGGDRVDVEWYPENFPREAIEKLAKWELRSDNLADLWSFEGDLDFVSRLATSRPVLLSPTLQGIRDAVEEEWPRIRQTMVNYWALTANSGLEDFYGACHSRDLGTATYIGQVLLTSAGKAVTAASGDKYFGRKWVYNQISRSLKAFPSDKYAHYQTGAWTRDGIEAAQNLLEFVQTCLAAGQLLAGEECSPELWPSWEYGESGLFRDLSYNILHQGDRVLLHKELHRQVSLKPQVAFVWALCQGQSLAGVCDQVEQLAQDVPVLRTMSEERVQNVVSALIERGLISTQREHIFSAIQES